MIAAALLVGLALMVWVWVAAVLIQLNVVRKQNGDIDLSKTFVDKGTAIIVWVTLCLVAAFVAITIWTFR